MKVAAEIGEMFHMDPVLVLEERSIRKMLIRVTALEYMQKLKSEANKPKGNNPGNHPAG